MKNALAALAFAIFFTVATLGFAQSPPGNGFYTYQAAGNLPAIITSLANPQLNQVPFGNGQTGYSLVIPGGDLKPGSTIGQELVGGAHYNVQTCSSSPCTVSSTNVVCNAATGPITVNLPGANGTGFLTWIEKTDSSTNACNITASGGDLISGVGAVAITNQYQSVMLSDQSAGQWQAGLFGIAGSSNGTGTFPLTASGNANDYSIYLLNNLMLFPGSPPASSVTATCTGTCATTYTYAITCLEDRNTETTPSMSHSVTNAASLSSSNKNVITWASSTECYNGYNIYGRVSGSIGLLATVGPSTLSYTDTGTATPGVPLPTYNQTGKITGTNLGWAVAAFGVNSTTNDFMPFEGIGDNALESVMQQPAPVVGTIHNMSCFGASTAVFTLRKNGADTVVTCTISGTTCNDTTDAVVVAAGDKLDTQETVTGGVAGCSYQIN